MATRRKKTPASGLSANADPRAALDSTAFLDQARPLLKELAQDLLERADHSGPVTETLQARHASERDAERTANAYPEWRRAFVEQVAAAWLLGAVFARTLEDRGLVGRNRIAGPGAKDSSRAFLELAPSLSEREYLLAVFRELSRLPAAAELFDTRHNPLWLLTPSAEGARKLLELFRSPDSEAPTFRFGGDDTRFLGDLYQDVSEDVRKRYALLQTPRFIEHFILDRTLEPATERFGLDDTTLIDPTCGSGHFLLGAFERLFDHRLRKEPGLSPREAATKALDAVAGADINPYAIAIARFRLTLAFLEKCGITKLKDAPRLPLHLVIADSLLYNPELGQLALVAGTDPARWEGSHFELEDQAAARDVLFKRYTAVVGNPPYITVKDPVLRERYRKIYVSAAGKYSLAAPFAERFFQLGRDGASIGMITANSFMKREFGKRLIEEYLPTVNLELIVNTSGAYIPGHGTPTVLLFGTREPRKGSDVLCVLASRGEPTTPDDPERGLVWSSIADHWSEVGFENEYISVANIERASLAKHPWSLGGGGAVELRELLEERAGQRLKDLATVGVFGMTNADDCMLMSASEWPRTPVEDEFIRTLGIGEDIRDWNWSTDLRALYPYRWPSSLVDLQDCPGLAKYLWPYRTTLKNRATFGGGTYLSDGLPWWKWHQVTADRVLGPTITFAFVATHNHFVLDRGGKVFKQSAPIIKLPETATEDDHLALLAYLNSSTACFWMKQVFYPKATHSEARPEKGIPEDNRYEFAGTALGPLPLPATTRLSIQGIARDLEVAAETRSRSVPERVIKTWLTGDLSGQLTEALGRAEAHDVDQLNRMIALQEDLDWQIYAAFQIVSPELAERFGACARLSPEERPFSSPTGQPPTRLTPADQALWSRRRDALRAHPDLALLEQPTFKRRWLGARGVFASKVATYAERCQAACIAATADAVETHLKGLARPVSLRSLREHVATDARLETCIQYAASAVTDGDAFLEAVRGASVPFLAAHVFGDSGMEKHLQWRRTWDVQRVEDSGQKVAAPPAPPKYKPEDYLQFGFWSLRGKLDVPKERFISYPGCESDEDKEPVYGWAGWDHLQRAVALAGLYQDRKLREGWAKDRLKPMLAGLLELLPWLKQWHGEPSAELGGERPSDQFEAFLNAECAEHGFTHDELRAWRPSGKKVASAKKPKKGKRVSIDDDARSDVD